MFGGFSGLPFQGQSGDKVVGSVATTAISALFKHTEALEARVKANPVSKILQGSLDGFDFWGQGLQMYNGLRLAALSLQVEAVAIDLSALLTGQVKLKTSTRSTMRVVLSEEDLTRSFNTPFILEKLQQVSFEGQALYFSDIEVQLLDDNQLSLSAKVGVGSTSNPVALSLKARLELQDDQRVVFTDVVYDGEGQTVALAQTLITHTNSLLDVEKFNLDGVQLRFQRCDTRDRKLIFKGTARFDQFPKRRS
ncbi:DUF2993 domain-containing protein [Leptolyngbya sp. FACHB-261]|uniref:LmeA family phospholipid-binding protein n=1 Tax=Leptolyngbya sp. FACHB-261 TaxID=2692806 RepID=UPI001686CA25|nr:DUF2993 domain-containing protein [Leptolyngbya sp. FACHB-261]MBD2102861.1 DUF2993 domain-containing protein [Leptolyngbya sp. FACHB-261]